MDTSIIEAVRKFARAEIPKYQNEKYYNSVPRQLFNEFAELGLAGMVIRESYQGIELDAQTIAACLQEIAKVDLGPAIFLSVHSMVSGLIQKFGNDHQRQHHLPLLAAGKHLAAFALTEASAGSDAANLQTSAKRQGDKYLLNGGKVYISSAGFADIYLVFARTSPATKDKKQGISAFIVESTRKGFSVGLPEKKMGCDLSPIATLAFDNVEIPLENLLGLENEGYKVAMGGLAGGRVNIASCANGLSAKAIELSVSHLRERKQFDQALINFQGLQFMLADMYMKFEASQLLTQKAARLLDQAPNDAANRTAPAVAKCFATDAAMSITTDAVQLLGGAGYIKDYGVERLMREAKMLQIVEGTNQIQRTIIARHLTELREF